MPSGRAPLISLVAANHLGPCLQLNVTAVAAFVREFGLDGADIDYEADAGQCGGAVVR